MAASSPLHPADLAGDVPGGLPCRGLPAPVRGRPGFWRAPFSAATYREVSFTLIGLPVGVAGFTVCTVLFSAGLGLLVTALGLPVLAALLTAARGFGALEREQARGLLAMEVTAPAPVVATRRGFWGGVVARAVDPAGWRAVLYQVLMFPWRVFGFTVSVTFLLTGWVVALYPAYHWVFARFTDWPGYRVFDYTTASGRHHAYYVEAPWQIAAVSLIGIALVLLTPQLVRGITNVHRLAIRGLLGAR
ncbi:sensor domain-containing protein [Kitasatospora camelliae]|uniref:Sensor domain-containing protein n=1 Tax=Kitasatospora camelliae TaxID=3156397 RepID=A0AAU8JYF1_9ACTN